MSEHRPSQVPIAIVGVSALTPGALDVEDFWKTVTTGRDLITDVPPTHWLIEDYYDPDPAAPDKTYGKRGSFLPPVDFDPLAFGIPPNALPATDTTQLLALLVAEQVLADATGGDLAGLDRERVSVILGTAPLDLLASMGNRLQRPVWLKALRESGIAEPEAQAICNRIADNYVPWQEASFPGLLSNVVAGRVANRFDLHGTNATTDAACASSLAAISTAVNELALGHADMVITGGVDTLNDILMYMCFSKTPALSPTGDCRPFSATADGTMLGEGLVMFALKRLADAERDGDRVYAVIRGVGSSSDGRSTAIYAPLPAGQARALRRAYESAGYRPDTVELVEAHGTGTKAGDVAEIAALREVFDETGRPERQWCAVGSIKSQIGHTKSAAGAAGLLKVALALHHKVLPPTIKVDRPNPAFELDSSPLYVNTQARPWVRGPEHPRRGSVSSFGFGGSNFHLTLEEYMPAASGAARPAWRARTAATELVLLSADSPDALVGRANALDADGRELADIARQTQDDFRSTDTARLAVVATDVADLAGKLAQAAALIAKEPGTAFSLPTGVHYGTGAASSGDVAFLFPGQGSQYVGMGADIAMQFSAAQAAWDRVADVRMGDRSLHDVVFPVPVFGDDERQEQEARLTATEWAQPALAAQSLALLGVLRALGVRPDALGGHSFGELVALHVAGAYDEPTLLRLARRRGELMREAAANPGAMLAIAGSCEEVDSLLARHQAGEVWVANHNGPRQVVVSGRTDAIDELARRLAADGVATTRLSAATAFHSPIVAGASGPMADFLAEAQVQAPRLDVFGNADAAVYPADPDAVRRRIADHIASPVRFVAEIEAMYQRGVRTFIEVGAGATLTRLVGQILGDHEHLAVSLDRPGKDGVTALHDALGRLAVGGMALDFRQLWADHAPPVAPKPAPKPGLTAKVSGANYGRPYPPAGGAAALPPPNPEVAPAPTPAPPVMPQPAQAPLVQPSAGDDQWLEVFQETQRQTAEAHAAYQQAMADSHAAFLRATASSISSMTPTFGGDVPVIPSPPIAPEPPAPVVPYHAPIPEPVETFGLMVPAPAPAPAPANSIAASAASSQDLEWLLLSVVADKTGYPVEMLNAGMELEGDLGIDSIKRVQILSALREQVPGLPEVGAADIGKLRTLGAIIERLGASVPAAPAVAPAPVPVAAAPSPDSRDLEWLLLSVVADKTGYPVEMLNAGMELEGDLGIDSIKRVQILSALREQVPGLPEVGAADIGKLRTLGAIIDRLGPSGASAKPAPVAQPATPALLAELQSQSDAAPLSRRVVRAVAAPMPGLALAGLRSGPLAVTDEGTGVAALVVAGLRAHKLAADVVTEVPPDAHGVVFLGGLRETATVDEAVAINREAFRAARAVADRFAAEGGVFVTVQDTGGDFGLAGSEPTRAWLGGLAGLARTAAREWPSAAVKAIDCQRGGRDAKAIADAIVAELLTGGPTIEVGLGADGARVTLHDADVPVTAEAPPPVDTESVIVVTGGGRGVTAAALRALAAARQPRIVLLGRTPLEDEPVELRHVPDEAGLRRAVVERVQRENGRLPTPAEVGATVARMLAGREIRATLKELKLAGADARYVDVDVRDAHALAAALGLVRQDWGQITGIVHGAGVLADKHIRDKTDDQFDRVFDTKVEGLRALLAATADDPITMLCVFSSVAARFGNVGQSDYAMANEVLAQVASAERAKRPGCLVRSIAWGPWEGGMVTADLAAHFHEQGVPLIPVDAGAQAFVAELGAGGAAAQVVIAAGNGGGALDGATPQVSAEVHVSARSHAHLADHDIAGLPVVPVAMALEWFVAAARSRRPELAPLVFRDIGVLRKLGLERFLNGGDRLLIRGRDGGEPGGGWELIGEGGTTHYRATVDGVAMAGGLGDGMPLDEPWDLADLPAPDRPAIYDGQVLFHGPSFQCIRELHGVSPAGAAATLVGALDLGWTGEHWHTDPLVIDGGLQLALLWAEQVLGGASLPMGVAEYRVHRFGPVDVPVRCEVRARRASDAQAECDVRIVDPDGRVRAELLGVTLVLRPDQARR